MKVKARLLSFASGAGFSSADPPGVEACAPRHPFFAGLPAGRAWVAAHRGGMNHWPENTLYAFEKALQAGVHMLEMDVRMTADGVPVIIHDERVDRTTDGAGRVSDFSFQEIRRLDAACGRTGAGSGERRYRLGRRHAVPCLQEVFETFPDARIILEIKESRREGAAAVGEVIGRYGREERTMVASFHTSLLRHFRKGYPGVATSAGRREVLRFWLFQGQVFHSLIRPGYVALQVPERWRGRTVVTPRFVRMALRKNLSVQVWTVNKPGDMHRLLDMGVEALITDEPGLALELTSSRAR